MDRSAIILAGGSSKGFTEDKGLALLNNKPLIMHVIDAVEGFVDEVIVVTDSKERAAAYEKQVPSDVQFAIDVCESKGPLTAALTGFEVAQGKYSLLLPFDAPFISEQVASLFLDLAAGKNAVIPRIDSETLEPLFSVYQTKIALETAKKLVEEGVFDLQAMVEELRGLRCISTLVVEQLDPDLRTFFRVKTPLDLKKAVVMTKPKPGKPKGLKKGKLGRSKSR